jgi:hypothetical protein
MKTRKKGYKFKSPFMLVNIIPHLPVPKPLARPFESCFFKYALFSLFPNVPYDI